MKLKNSRFKVGVYSISASPKYLNRLGIKNTGQETDTSISCPVYNPSWEEWKTLIKDGVDFKYNRVSALTKDLKKVVDRFENSILISFNRVIDVECIDATNYEYIKLLPINDIPMVVNIIILMEYVNGKFVVRSIDLLNDLLCLQKSIINNRACLQYLKAPNNKYVIDYVYEYVKLQN